MMTRIANALAGLRPAATLEAGDDTTRTTPVSQQDNNADTVPPSDGACATIVNPEGLFAHKVHAYVTEAGYQLLSNLRMPGYVLPTLGFPGFFYVFFALLVDTGAPIHLPTYLIATYGTFGVIAPALFGFGAGVAAERGEGWLRLKLASPMPPGAYLFAKVITAMAFALSVVIMLFALGGVFGGVSMGPWRWLTLALTLILGSVPFCALGLWIGLKASPQAAPAIVNLVYLPMSFCAGLWIPLMFLPESFQYFAWALPPFHLAQLALAAAGLESAAQPLIHLGFLLAFTVVFMALARKAWRRGAFN